MDMQGEKLKRKDVDDLVATLSMPKVVVRTDMAGFRLFVESYQHWFSAPYMSVDTAAMTGIHPSGVGMDVQGSKSMSGMTFYENYDDPSVVGSFENYT